MCRRPRQPPGWPVAAPRAETSTLHPLRPSQPSAGEGEGGKRKRRGGREGEGDEAFTSLKNHFFGTHLECLLLTLGVHARGLL